MQSSTIPVEALVIILIIKRYKELRRNNPTRVNMEAFLAVPKSPRAIQAMIDCAVKCGYVEQVGEYLDLPSYCLTVEGEFLFNDINQIFEGNGAHVGTEFEARVGIADRKISKKYGAENREWA